MRRPRHTPHASTKSRGGTRGRRYRGGTAWGGTATAPQRRLPAGWRPKTQSGRRRRLRAAAPPPAAQQKRAAPLREPPQRREWREAAARGGGRGCRPAGEEGQMPSVVDESPVGEKMPGSRGDVGGGGGKGGEEGRERDETTNGGMWFVKRGRRGCWEEGGCRGRERGWVEGERTLAVGRDFGR